MLFFVKRYKKVQTSFYIIPSLPKRLINSLARNTTMICEILDSSTQKGKQINLLGRRQRPELSLGYPIKAKALHTAVLAVALQKLTETIINPSEGTITTGPILPNSPLFL